MKTFATMATLLALAFFHVRPGLSAEPVNNPLNTSSMSGYVPPLRGAPSRRVGGSSRGAEHAMPEIFVVAPDHVGLTTLEQPVLYWFISKPTRVRVEVTLIDDDGIKPLLELPLESVDGPGIHALDLQKYGIRLKLGTEYQWSVALIPDTTERSGDVISGGAIKRIEAAPTLREALGRANSVLERTQVYAGSGIWYDAMTTISRSIDADPTNVSLKTQRAILNEQIGLADVAAFDRKK